MMKAKIDEHGILFIERAGEMKQMRCAERHDHFCRDCCALFGDIEPGRDSLGNLKPDADCLRLCQVTLQGDIVDQRQAPRPLGHPDHDKTCALNNGDVVCTCGKAKE